MAMNTMRIELEVEMNVSAERLWEALTMGELEWWGADFRVNPASTKTHFEAWPGGRLWEEGEGGAGTLWYHVANIQPGKRLQLVGPLMPPFCGPAISMVCLDVEQLGEGSVLKISDVTWGEDCAGKEGNTTEGWKMLFEGMLKPWLESQ